MRIFITGATGLIGSRLVTDRLVERGDEVVALTRSPPRAKKKLPRHEALRLVEGDPSKPGEWQPAVDGCDAVVHLAGAGIADRRWSAAYKRELVDSRVESARQVVQAMRDAADRPRTLVSGSAVGYYGDRGSEAIDESSPAGDDFLAQLCVRWEKAAGEARGLGVRVVTLRSAPVLDPRGGALPTMTRPFRFFMGGWLGSGRQFMPWIHWQDEIGLIDLALREGAIGGPLNACSPDPVTGREFARALGRVLHRPAWLPTPRVGLRITLGEVANFITMSQRIRPARALEGGYRFAHPHLEPALRSLLAP